MEKIDIIDLRRALALAIKCESDRTSLFVIRLQNILDALDRGEETKLIRK